MTRTHTASSYRFIPHPVLSIAPIHMDRSSYNPWHAFPGIQRLVFRRLLLQDARLNWGDRLLVSFLYYHCGTKSYCWPSQKCLAHELAISDRNVRIHLTRLRQFGWISSKRRYKESCDKKQRTTDLHEMRWTTFHAAECKRLQRDVSELQVGSPFSPIILNKLKLPAFWVPRQLLTYRQPNCDKVTSSGA